MYADINHKVVASWVENLSGEKHQDTFWYGRNKSISIWIADMKIYTSQNS